MVKLKGPCLSTIASGTLGDIFTFNNRKSATTARKKPHPTDPRTQPQQATREMFSFLSQQWHLLTADQQATWQDVFPGTASTRYLSYLKYNLDRWARFAFPSKTYPATEDGVFSNAYKLYLDEEIYYVGVKLRAHVAINDTWAILVTRTLGAPYTPKRNSTVLLWPVYDTNQHIIPMHPPRPGTYWYWGLGFTTKGNSKGLATSAKSASVQ